MSNAYYQTHSLTLKHCRWCQSVYSAFRPVDKDGFCSPTCKQAHYRAYKKWVTAKHLAAERAQGRKVTPKTRQKKQV